MAADERGYLFDLAGIRYVHDGDSSDEELPQRARLRFFGVTVADNPTALDGAGCLDITVTGGGEGGEPEGAAGGDLFGTYPDPFVKGYHPSAGGTQVLIGSHPVGSLLERTGTNTAAGSAYWFYGTTTPQGNISKTEGALYLKTDTHELYQNVSDGSGTDWERVWPLQIIDVTGGSPVAMPARPRIRFLSGTITDNSGQNSTDITPGGGSGVTDALFRIIYDSDANESPNDYSFTFDNASPGSATWIRIADYNVDGVEIAKHLQIPTGALLTLRSLDGTVDLRLRATAAPTDGSGYTQFAVTVLGSTGSLTPGETYVLEMDAVGSGATDFPILFGWQTMLASPGDPLVFDVLSEHPTLADGIYLAELRIVGVPNDNTYGLAGKAIFRVRIASGAVTQVHPAAFSSSVSSPDGNPNYYGSLGDGVSGTFALNSGNIDVTVLSGGGTDIYVRLAFIDVVSV